MIKPALLVHHREQSVKHHSLAQYGEQDQLEIRVYVSWEVIRVSKNLSSEQGRVINQLHDVEDIHVEQMIDVGMEWYLHILRLVDNYQLKKGPSASFLIK
jgi:hypothetical protein